MQAEKPELNKLLRDQLQNLSTKTKITREDTPVVSILLIAYGIIEEAFLLYTKKWIDEDTWGQWAAWLKDLSRHPRFDLIHTTMKGQFDKRFEEHVAKMLENNSHE